MATYVGYADRHIRPLIGATKVGALDGDVFDSLYAELRRCRIHCDRRPDHRARTLLGSIDDRSGPTWSAGPSGAHGQGFRLRPGVR